MSYILDALNKSQQERDLGQVPGLETEHSSPPSPSRRTRPWAMAGVTAAVAVLAAVLYGVIGGGEVPEQPLPALSSAGDAATGDDGGKGVAPAQGPATAGTEPDPADTGPVPWQTPAGIAEGMSESPPPRQVELPVGAPRPATTVAAVRPAPPVAVPTQPRPVPMAPAAVRGPAPAAPVSPPAVPEPPPAVPQTPFAAAVGSRPTAVPMVTQAPAVTPEDPLPAKPAPVPETPALPLLADMPYDFQQRVPRLTVNVHAYYPEPEARFAYINMRKYGEGVRMDEGVTIEAITPEGLVLEFGGQRFRLGR